MPIQLGRVPMVAYDMLGNVWEWTAVFQGYEGFVSYAGYSKVYFDGQHWVLKGQLGNVLGHCALRNWYYRHSSNPGRVSCAREGLCRSCITSVLLILIV